MRPHGHDLCLQNAAPAVLNATDNIGFNNFDMGLQAYGGGSTSWVQNIRLAGNIIFNSPEDDYRVKAAGSSPTFSPLRQDR